jgi:hypothetical protein
MKTAKNTTILALIFIIYMGNIFACKNTKNISIALPEIKTEDIKIDSIINLLIEDNQEYLKKGCYILISQERHHELKYIDIVIYEKEKFKLNCNKNDYPIIGYTEFNNQTILIVGENYLDKMKFMDKKKNFIFKCNKVGKKYPPSLYNPHVHRFLYNNNGIIQSK